MPVLFVTTFNIARLAKTLRIKKRDNEQACPMRPSAASWKMEMGASINRGEVIKMTALSVFIACMKE